jgi:hypothetical protein
MRPIVSALTAVCLAVSSQSVASDDDLDIARRIVDALKSQQDAGDLKGFDVHLTGHVSTQGQLEAVESTAAGVQGIERVDNRLWIRKGSSGDSEKKQAQ